MCFIESADSSLCGLAATTVVAVPSPLVAVVAGCNQAVGEGARVQVDAGASFDPDAPAGSVPSLSFVWECVPPPSLGRGGACLDASGALARLPPQGAGAASAAVTLTLMGSPSGANYTLRVTVATADGRSDRQSVWLVVRSGVVTPTISLTPPAAAVGGVNPSSKIVLLTSVSPSLERFAGGITTTWSLAAAPASLAAFSLADASAVPLSSASLVLRPGVLPPRSSVVLRLTATDPGSNAAAEATVTVTTANAPRGTGGRQRGTIAVAPASGGFGLETNFTLSASGWCASLRPPSLYS